MVTLPGMVPQMLLLLIALAAYATPCKAVGLQIGPALAADVARDLGIIPVDFTSSRGWGDDFKVDMQLLGAGFHRDVKYQVEYVAVDASELKNCQVAFLQHLPSSVFADPYQLEEITRHAASSSTHTPADSSSQSSTSSTHSYTQRATTFSFKHYGPLDLELPAPACDPTALLLRFNLTTQQQPSQPLSAVFTVPLHAKYPEPQVSGYAGWQSLTTGHVGVVLPWPLLIVDCRASGGKLQMFHAPTEQDQHQQCMTSSSTDAPLEADCASQSLQQHVVWSVPSGNLDHLQCVSWATLFVTATCCVLLSVKAVRVAAEPSP